MIFRFDDDAILEIEDAISYSRQKFGQGEKLSVAIKKAIGEIVADPCRFAQHRDGFRSHKLPRFPFRLFFEVSDSSDTVVFYALAHTSRHSNYWKSRISDS